MPNRLGEGERLRQEILDTAARILEESGSEDALSLRGIAREVGIAAPSIYLHFKNKADLLWTLLADAYTRLAAAMEAAGRAAEAEGADPWGQLLATSAAYRRFAVDNPGRYRLMFNVATQVSAEHRVADVDPLARLLDIWVGVIGRYLEAVSPERLEETETLGVLVWTGMHGQYTLWHALPPHYAEANEAVLAKFEHDLMRDLLRPG
ncbi:TetR/AcrR family transcriptional regulator [Nocardiopsis mangrovi]|uniref:TetR/AcrR family transcriptional regulator n=1 Tax=Nocardiopsis mangrovi TaxID=1179818 RepID=A0ABV9E1C7_9ACTN